jgi:methionyl-tRNA synthetase
MSFYVTTPIYYVNDKPHIGHAYTTIAADILARHHRQRGEETFFLTGVDEHATKVWRAAEAQGLSAQEFVDRIAAVWRELPKRVNAETDFFLRTTDDGHKAFVRDFLQRIYDNGDVYEDVYSGPYCVSCEEFKSEDELIDGKCPIHLIPVERIEEKNYFFRGTRARSPTSGRTHWSITSPRSPTPARVRT